MAIAAREVIATVSSRISIQADALPPGVIERVRRDLSFPNPEWQKKKALGFYADHLEPRLSCIDEIGSEVYMPRGAIDALKRRAAEAGYKIVFRDYRVGGHEIETMGLRGKSLRPYQEVALDLIEKKIQSYVVIPCGGGKTTLGIAAIDRIKRSTLIMIHTDDLADQWDADCRKVLDIDPVRITRETTQLGAINIANVRTLRMLKEERHPLWLLLRENIGFLILDEAHHAPATTFDEVLNDFPARHRLGLTATPDREDGKGPMLGWVFGPRVFEISVEELMSAGYLVSPDVIEVRTDFRFDYNEITDMTPMEDALCEDAERNALIVSKVKAEAGAGAHCLVLTKRVDHVEKLAELIAEAGVESVAFAHGQVSKKKRKQIIESWKARETQVLVANVIADEGLDAPSLQALFLCAPAKAKGATMQRVGRLMRPHESKDGALECPRVYDFVDQHIDVLWRQAGDRMSVFRRVDKTLAQRRKSR